MSNQAMTWAFKQDVKPSPAKFVLVALANYANGDGYCYAGQDRIAIDTGQSERSVRTHLADLEAAGWIVRERRNHKSGQRAVDGFYLVGFSDNQPANLAGSQPEESAGSQPETLAGRGGVPTGKSRQTNRQISPPHTIGIEPTIEPTIATPQESASQSTSKNGKCRAPDLLWETLVDIHGFRPTDDTPEHGRWNKAVGIYRRLNLRPEDIPVAYDRYRATFPRASVTVMAVAGRAEELLRGKAANPSNEPRYWNGWKN